MSETFGIASDLKLKVTNDYSIWKQAIEAAIEAHGLQEWMHEKSKAPEVVDPFDENVDQVKLAKYREWKAADGKTKLLIMNSILTEPFSVINGKETAREMWRALERQYQGTGEALLWRNVEAYCRLDISQFNGVTEYCSAFKDVKACLERLNKTNIKDWHSIIYAMDLANEFPDWARRQRAALRSNSPPTLEEIMEDRFLLPA